MSKRILLIATVLSLSFYITNAQDTTATKKQTSTTPSKKWGFFAEPYLLIPNMEGTMGVGKLPDVNLDVTPSEIFSHFKMGAMLYLEAHTDKWAITSDFLFMNLGQDISGDSSRLINSGDVTVKETLWELGGLYKVCNWFEIGPGFRLYNLKNDVSINYINGLNSDSTRSGSLSETWVDPIVITRIKAPLKNKKILLQLRTDFGGIVGSKFTWQTQLDVGYQFSKLFQTTIGYRYLDVNYETGSGSDRFLYDMATFGPQVRFGFNF